MKPSIKRFAVPFVGIALALIALIAWQGVFADAGNPILNTIKANAVDNGDGTVTIYVRGQWNWLSHSSDCNYDRAAAGVGVIWNDLNGPGTTRGNNETQSVTITGNPTGGTFKLKFSGQTTGTIPYNATAAQLDAALEALSNVGAGDVNVTGGPGPGAAFSVEFTGALAKTNVAQMTLANKSFTGGTNPNVVIATTTGGLAPVFNGFLVANGAISAYVGTANASFNGATQINPVDRMVHPDDLGNQVEGYTVAGTDYPASQVFADPASNNPADYLTWKGGCGRQPITAIASKGANPERTGNNCGTTPGSNVCAGHPWGSWGYMKNSGLGYSHTYLKVLPDGSSGLPERVCVNFYDVHGGGTTAPNFQLVKGASEITVDGNGDNSIDTNAFNVFATGTAASNCIAIITPVLTTTATNGTVGGNIHDTGHLSGVPAIAGGSITFKVYGPDPTPGTNAADDCTASILQSTLGPVSVSGPGDYGSGDFDTTSSGAGTYHWTASYSGDPPNLVLGADTACGDDGETSTVAKKQPTMSTNAGGAVQIDTVNGNDLTDDATLGNANSPNATGTIRFYLYADNGSGGCGTQVGTVDKTGINGNGTYTSPTIHVSAAGTYHWVAIYLGDSNYLGVGDDTSDASRKLSCNGTNENKLVIAPSIDVSKTPPSQSVPLNGTAHFTILVTNNGDSRLTSIVIGDALAPGCARNAAETDALILAKYGAGHAYLDPTESFTYNCDSNPVTAPFVNVVTACGTPPVGSQVCDTDTNGGSPPPGCPATEADRCAGVTPSSLTTEQDFKPRDTATLTGLAGTCPGVSCAGGTVTYRLYKGAVCDANHLLDTLTAPVSGNDDYTVTSAKFLSELIADNIAGGGTVTPGTDGTYNWQVSYSGDVATNNAAIPAGACGTGEHFVVTN